MRHQDTLYQSEEKKSDKNTKGDDFGVFKMLLLKTFFSKISIEK
jgi:hypothetical protein